LRAQRADDALCSSTTMNGTLARISAWATVVPTRPYPTSTTGGDVDTTSATGAWGVRFLADSCAATDNSGPFSEMAKIGCDDEGL
jgi:hypothetical protein